MKKILPALISAIILLIILFSLGCNNPDSYLRLSGYTAPENINVDTEYKIEGIIECNDTIKCAGIRIKDISTNRYEVSKTLNNHENIFNLNRLNEYVDFRSLSQGEKVIEIIAIRSNYVEVLQKNKFIVNK